MKGPKPKEVAERFWPKVRKTDCCWEWTGGTTIHGAGYGIFAMRPGRPILARRVSWELTNGPVPKGHFILQICLNDLCVRPSHLWCATPKEKTERQRRMGLLRGGSSPGEQNPNAKLTDDAVIQIRSSALSVEELALQHDVSMGTIYKLKSGAGWPHVPTQ